MEISDEASPVCVNCTSTISRDTSYCPHCGRPVGMFGSLDPVQSIYAAGWGYQNAVSKYSNKAVLWGMWLIFAPGLLLLFDGVYSLLQFGRGEAREYVSVLLILGVGALYSGVLYRVTKNYIRHRRYRSGICGVCKYDLRLLREPRCPECGTKFDPDLLPDRGGTECPRE
jgi:predicted amidophosphoribosyltransferase